MLKMCRRKESESTSNSNSSITSMVICYITLLLIGQLKEKNLVINVKAKLAHL